LWNNSAYLLVKWLSWDIIFDTVTGTWNRDYNQSSFLILYVFTILHTRTLQNIATNKTVAIFMKEDGTAVEMYTFCLSVTMFTNLMQWKP